MKILILNYEHPPLGGGGGRVSQNLAEEWASQGHSVDIVTSHFEKLPKFEEQLGYRLYRVPILGRREIYTSTFLSMCAYLITGFLKGFQLCRKNKYDIINTYFAVPTGPIGVLLSKIFKIKNVLNILGGDIYNPNYKVKPHQSFFFKTIITWVLNNSTSIIADSQDIKDKAEQFYQSTKKISVIPVGFKKPNFKKLSRQELLLSDNKFYLISVSRLVLRKRIDRIIKALSGLNNFNIELLILGDGPEKENLENLAFKLGIRNQVHFLGFVSEEKKFQYLTCSDALISTSEHEGFGINFQEAMSCNLPIISTDCKGILDSYKGCIFRFTDINFKETIDLIKDRKKQRQRNYYHSMGDISKRYFKIFQC